MLVYTAHSHLTIDRSKDIALFVLKQGYVPLDPFLTLPPEVYDYLGFKEEDCVNTDIKVLEHCDELWVFGNSNSPGVSKEIDWWLKNRAYRVLRHFSWDKVPRVFSLKEIEN